MRHALRLCWRAVPPLCATAVPSGASAAAMSSAASAAASAAATSAAAAAATAAAAAAAGWSATTCECCMDEVHAWQRASTTDTSHAQPPPQVRRTLPMLAR
eukprot:scaffold87525_cov58-Phaeocystis_antarctica.AAC.6